MARLRMNLEVLFVVLACNNLLFCPKAHGLLQGSVKGQKECAAPGTPININVGNCMVKGQKGDKGSPGVKGDMGAKGEKGDQGSPAPSCKCNLQDPKKPSAHIEAANKGNAAYQNNQVIKDWSTSAPNSHVEGGMTYNDGKLTVPIAGRYYVYAQFYYHDSGRIFIRVNNKFITMLQPAVGSGSRHGALYSGGVFNLNAGDVITVLATNGHGTVRGYMGAHHSYFGAFLI